MEQRARVTLAGPFYEGDVLNIPFDFLGCPTASTTQKDHPYTHFVVLDKVGWWGRRYKLRGVRGEAYALHLPLPRMVGIERDEG